uniref:Ornithine carbamoyltransferase n=1 Tax=candidate division WOR-3 bacterium TaxID=2052148 RepID=A0A7C2PKK5_UNCW3
MKKDFLSILDLSIEEAHELLDFSLKVKKGKVAEKTLDGKVIALIFEKPSLRTRVTFERAIYDLGGKPIYLSNNDIKLGQRESVKDVSRNLEKWVDGIVARVFAHSTLIEMAQNVRIPVINALSDLEHPCQIVGDYLTILEKSGRTKVNLSFIGDGNNVANSLMLMTALLGGKFTIACPEGYEPNKNLYEKAMEISKITGAKIEIVRDPKEAVKDADFIYTDVWASMGQEHEAEQRRQIFKNYRVDSELLRLAPSHVAVLHCLPAHRGEEITDEVLDGPHSIVLDQAENRLHSEKAILIKLFRNMF